jgi:hypothetical protein
MDGMWMVTQDTAPPFDARTFTITGTTYRVRSDDQTMGSVRRRYQRRLRPRFFAGLQGVT